jgi:hypothetical protein
MRRVIAVGVEAGVLGTRLVMMVSLGNSSAKSKSLIMELYWRNQYKNKE